MLINPKEITYLHEVGEIGKGTTSTPSIMSFRWPFIHNKDSTERRLPLYSLDDVKVVHLEGHKIHKHGRVINNNLTKNYNFVT